MGPRRASAGLVAAATVVTSLATAAPPAAGSPGFGDTGDTSRVSVSSTGSPGDGPSFSSAVSADGRFVAFVSDADDLVPGDTNGLADVFVRDRWAGTTERVSVSSAGAQAEADFANGSFSPAMSPDGRFVTFSSFAHTLVPGDTNDAYDVFLRDRVAGTTERVSVSDTGAQGAADSSFGSSVSRDGRYVVFTSAADDLVEGDTNGSTDVLVRDRVAGTTRRVSLSSTGAQSDGPSSVSSTSVSASGRFVVFDSAASNLVAQDSNGTSDVFVRDTATGATRRVSVSSTGRQARSYSNGSSISADGRMVAFTSDASNLVAGDDNRQVDVFRRDRRTGRTRLVSVSSSGEQGDFFSQRPALSAGGRFVVFQSQADNLVPGDTNVADDVFVRDVRDGTTSRVSVDSRGLEATPAFEFGEVGYDPAISRTGRFVAFASHSDFLVPGDTNRVSDVFLRERTPALQTLAG